MSSFHIEKGHGDTPTKQYENFGKKKKKRNRIEKNKNLKHLPLTKKKQKVIPRA